jgi:hypothetical protein
MDREAIIERASKKVKDELERLRKLDPQMPFAFLTLLIQRELQIS